jgi:hypothetical protein
MTDTTTERVITEITAQDKRALRNADKITFNLHGGVAMIRAHRDGEHTASGFDDEHRIYTDVSVADYDPRRGDPTMEAYSCYHWIGWPKHDHTTQSLLSRIAVGDTLKLEWTAGNDNDNYRSVGFHRDELRLVIGHKNGKAEKYLVAVSVGPDNTARMVRRVR